MILFYNIGLFLYQLFAKILSFFNQKAKKWVDGRRNFPVLKYSGDREIVWFHIASLGEYEQAKPVMEALYLKNFYIVITFFSPSGYELRKNNSITQDVFYLPIDNPKNARRLINEFNPQMAFFVKYDLWFHYINQLYKKHIPIYLLSVLLSNKKSFIKQFSWQFNSNMYRKMQHIFTQDGNSKMILNKIGIEQVSVSGDTRIDAVIQTVESTTKNDKIELFKSNQPILILGSSYKNEEDIALQLISSKTWPYKVIIAPHQIDDSRIKEIENKFTKSIKYSELNNDNFNTEVLIIDNIGMLKQLYAYADIAIIGGGFRKSIHNTLEPAAFGLPLFFGPNYTMFKEAIEMKKRGAAFSFNNYEDFITNFKPLLINNNYKVLGAKNKQYIYENKGATKIVLNNL